jgi:hypothetical protein
LFSESPYHGTHARFEALVVFLKQTIVGFIAEKRIQHPSSGDSGGSVSDSDIPNQLIANQPKLL